MHQQVAPPQETTCSHCNTLFEGMADDQHCPQCARAGFDLALSPDTITPLPTEELQEKIPHLEIVSSIGQGGMGLVYKVVDPRLDREFAIKVLPPELAEDERIKKRFLSEAKALAKLSHPNIVGLIDFVEGDSSYISMEYVEGQNLQHKLQQAPLSNEEIARIIREVGAAIQYLHRQGVVHRDLKPSNILVAEDESIKVADFGLAAFLVSHAENAPHRLTDAMSVVGTLEYLAPEQRAGKPIDERADIYSMGVILHEMCTGKLPETSPSIPAADRYKAVPIPFRHIVSRALQPAPNDRYADVSGMIEALADTCKPQQRHLTKAVLVTGLLLAAFTIGTIAWSTREVEETVATVQSAADREPSAVTALELVPMSTVGVDLTPVRMALEPKSLPIGSDLNLRCEIMNAGSKPSQRCVTSIRLNRDPSQVTAHDRLLAITGIPPLEPTATHWIEATFRLTRHHIDPVGDYQVWVILDTNSQAGQDNEHNDRLRRGITVRGKLAPIDPSLPLPEKPKTLGPGILFTEVQAGKTPPTVSLEPILEWEPNTDAEFYGIYIEDTTTKALIHQIETVPPTGRYQVPKGALQPGRHYKWNTRGWNTSGFGLFSKPSNNFITTR